MTEYTRKNKMFYLGGAGGYPIVPGNKTEIVLELPLVCIRMEKTLEKTLQNTKVKLTWPEHRAGEPQYWQHPLMLHLYEDFWCFSVKSVILSDDIQ